LVSHARVVHAGPVLGELALDGITPIDTRRRCLYEVAEAIDAGFVRPGTVLVGRALHLLPRGVLAEGEGEREGEGEHEGEASTCAARDGWHGEHGWGHQ
jgi:hypothetical protein